ncbi:MAG: hypothetical protein ABSA43_01230 [Candidatus Microgenomates bacterium]|jgi:hypothetical protein
MSKEICSWEKIEAQLPNNLPEGSNKKLKGYFRVQERLARKQNKRAQQLSNMLNNIAGFTELEDRYEGVFAAIDVAVNGRTNREVEPVFRINS